MQLDRLIHALSTRTETPSPQQMGPRSDSDVLRCEINYQGHEDYLKALRGSTDRLFHPYPCLLPSISTECSQVSPAWKGQTFLTQGRCGNETIPQEGYLVPTLVQSLHGAGVSLKWYVIRRWADCALCTDEFGRVSTNKVGGDES